VIENINAKIGKKIAQLRKEIGLSQNQLAEKSGLSTEYISRLERGINAPSVQSMNVLADVLRVDIRDFFTFSESDWEIEIEALVVLLKNKQGKSIRKVFKLAEIEGE